MTTGKQACSCFGWGWAEVKVRRPSGNVAWTLRLQNEQEQPVSWREGRHGRGSVSEQPAVSVTEENERGKHQAVSRESAFSHSKERETQRESTLPVAKNGHMQGEGNQSPWQQTPFPWQLNIEEDTVQEKTVSSDHLLTDIR